MASLFRSEEQALQQIVQLIPSNSEDISIFDILKAYDTYIEQSGISFEDPFAYEIYEIIIHASRRAEDSELRNLLTNYKEIQKLKQKTSRKNSVLSDHSDQSDKYVKQLQQKEKKGSRINSKKQSLSPYQSYNKSLKNSKKEYNIQFKNFDTSSGEENEETHIDKNLNTQAFNPEANDQENGQQYYRSRLGQYHLFSSSISKNGTKTNESNLKITNPFNDNMYIHATEQGQFGSYNERYNIRKYSYSPNNKLGSSSNFNRSISPVQNQNFRSLSPYINNQSNSKAASYQIRMNTSNSNNSFNSGVNQNQKVRFHTQNADEYVNIQSPQTSLNNPQIIQQQYPQNSNKQQQQIIDKYSNQASTRSVGNQAISQPGDIKKYLSLESRDYQKYQFMPDSPQKRYLSLDAQSHQKLMQQRQQNEQQLESAIETGQQNSHSDIDELQYEVQNELAKGLRRKWILYYHFANWKDFITRWKGATEYINKEEQIENYIQLKLQRKYFQIWEQHVNEENNWKETKLNFVLKRRENILRKCFNEMKNKMDDNKVDRYTYYAAKYKKEQGLKEKYFQQLISFSRNHRANRLKLERTQTTAANFTKRNVFQYLKQLKDEKVDKSKIKNDLKTKQSILEKKISLDRFVNSIRSILCFKKKKEILNKAIEIQLKQHSLLTMIDNFRIIKYFKIQSQRADDLLNKNLSQKFFYHLKLFLFNRRDIQESAGGYSKVRTKGNQFRQWQKYVNLQKKKEQKYKDGRIIYMLYRLMIMILNESDYTISQQRNIQFEALKEQVMFLQHKNQHSSQQQNQSFGKGDSDDEQYNNQNIGPTHQSLMQNSNSNNNLLSARDKSKQSQKTKNAHYLFSRSTQATAIQNYNNPNQVFDTVRSFSPALPRIQNQKTQRNEVNQPTTDNYQSDQEESDNQRHQRQNSQSENNFVYQTHRQSNNNIVKQYENQENVEENQLDEEIALQIIENGIFFTFPSIFSINYLKKTQTEKLFHAHLTLNKFILNKSFRCWNSLIKNLTNLNKYRQRNDFRKKIQNQIYQKHFQSMKTFCVKSQCHRYCIEKMQKKMNKKMIENIRKKEQQRQLRDIKIKNGQENVKEYSTAIGYSKNYEQAGIYYKKWLMKKSFASIQNFAKREQELKVQVHEKIQNNSYNKTNKIFSTWRTYSHLKRQRNFIYNQIRKIFEQKVYKECFNVLANYRYKHSRSTSTSKDGINWDVEINHLDTSWTQLEDYNQEDFLDFQKQKMIKSDHLIFLKLTIFNAFVKYHRKKKYERKSAEYIKCRQQLTYAKSSMKQWKRLHQFNKNVAYLCAKSILTIKNQILEKYFSILKQKWAVKSQEKRIIQDKQFALKKKILLGLRRYTLYKLNNYENMIQLNENRKRMIKQNILSHWLRKLYNKQNSADVFNALIKYRKHKTLQLWADLYNIKNKNQKTIKISDFSGFRRLEQTQEITLIKNSQGKKRNLRQFFFNMLKLNQKILLQRVFTNIKELLSQKKIDKKKVEKIQESVQVKQLSKAIELWRNVSQKRIRKYNMIKKIKDAIQHYQQRIGFESIQGQEKIYLELIQKSKKALIHRQKYLKKNNFAKLKAYAFKKIKTARIKEELDYNIQRHQIVSVFNKFRYFMMKREENKKKNELAIQYLFITKLKKIFNRLKTYKETRQVINQKSAKLNKYLNRKKVRRGFAQIKANYLENKCDEFQLLESSKFMRQTLLVKSFAMLRKNCNINRQKKLVNNQASFLYSKNLGHRILLSLQDYIYRKNASEKDNLCILHDYRQKKNTEIKQGVLMVWKYYSQASKNQLQDFRKVINSSVLRQNFIEWKIKTHLMKDKRMKIKIIKSAQMYKIKFNLFQKWRQRAKLHSVLTNTFVYHAKMEIKKRLVKWNQLKNLIKKNENKANQQLICKPKSKEDTQKMKEVFQLMKNKAAQSEENKRQYIQQQKKQDEENYLQQQNFQSKSEQLTERLQQLRYFTSAQTFIHNLKQKYILKKQEQGLMHRNQRMASPKLKNKLKNSMIDLQIIENKKKEQIQKVNRIMMNKKMNQTQISFNALKAQANQIKNEQMLNKSIESQKQFAMVTLIQRELLNIIDFKVVNQAYMRKRFFFLKDAFRQIQVRFIKQKAARTFIAALDKTMKLSYAKRLFNLFQKFQSKTQVLKHLIEKQQFKVNTEKALQFFNLLKNLKIEEERSNQKCMEYLFMRRIKQMKTVLAILSIYTQYRRNKSDSNYRAVQYRKEKTYIKLKQKYLNNWIEAYQQKRQQNYFNQYDENENYDYENQQYENEQQQQGHQLQQYQNQMMQWQGGLQNQNQQSSLTDQQKQLQLLQQQYQKVQQEQQQLLFQQQQKQLQNKRYSSSQSEQIPQQNPTFSDENEYFTEEPITYSDVPSYQINPQYTQNINFDYQIDQQNLGAHTQNQMQQLNQFREQDSDIADLLFDKPRQYFPQQQNQLLQQQQILLQQMEQLQQQQKSKQSTHMLSQEHHIINEQSDEQESGNDSQLQKYLRVSQSDNQDQQNESYQDHFQEKDISEQQDIQNEISYQEEQKQSNFSSDQKKDQSNISKGKQISGKDSSKKQSFDQIQMYQQQMSFENKSQKSQSRSNQSHVQEYCEEDFLDEFEEESPNQSIYILNQFLQQKQESLIQMVFNIWRNHTIDQQNNFQEIIANLIKLIQHRKINRNHEDDTMQSAHEVYQTKLTSKMFGQWKDMSQERINMSRQQMKSYLYGCFTSWKMFAKEKKILKKYLDDAEMDEQLAYTPQTTERVNLIFNNNDPRSSVQKFQRSGSYNNLESSNRASSDSQKNSSLASALFTGKLKIQDTLNLDRNAPH